MMALASSRMSPCASTSHTIAPRSSPKCLVARAAYSQQPQQLPFWQHLNFGPAAAAALLAATLWASPAHAGLNRYEYDQPTEFGKGSAGQYGEANLDDQDFKGQDLRRSNFTSASAKRANFKDTNLQGAYFMKAVVFEADFTNANLSDTLMDRAVINKAILRNANLQRSVLTRSDLTGADVFGADFTNALLDKSQQIALCRYADGTNTVTGVETRKSLGCGSGRRFRGSSPSNPDGPQVAPEEQDAFRKTLPNFRE